MKLSVTLGTDGKISMTNPDKWELTVGETVVFVPEARVIELETAIRESLEMPHGEAETQRLLDALYREGK